MRTPRLRSVGRFAWIVITLVALAAGTARSEAGTDASLEHQIQAALAEAGFDPGPVDGKLGPKTRSAIRAWQRANGYVADGFLSAEQFRAMLTKATPAATLEPFGPNWIIAENQPCQLYNPEPEPGETVTWSGGCVDGKTSGVGWLVWRYGKGELVYDGVMRAGKYDGYGSASSPSGSHYEGEWRNGERHGRGRYTSPNGEHYEGAFREGTRTGRGTYTWPNGARYEGEFRDGKQHGSGVWTGPDGSLYDGEWRDGKKHGFGTFISVPLGYHYDGEWRDGVQHGFGILVLPNRTRYEGQWRYNKPNGQGTYTLLDGTRFEGEWHNGCFEGGWGKRAAVATSPRNCGFE